jgi:hypothetical protein
MNVDLARRRALAAAGGAVLWSELPWLWDSLA